MKIRKTVTDKVIEANRENGKKGTGAKTCRGKDIVSRNAIKHGILARKFPFSSDREKAAYRRLLERVAKGIDRKDPFQRMVAEECVMAHVRRARALKFEQKVCEQQNPATELALQTINESELMSDGMGLIHLDPTWECKELHMSAKKSHDCLTRKGPESSGHGNGEELQVNVKFQDPLDKALRYQRATARDFYKALQWLSRLQKKRESKSKHSRHHRH
jgi:hypothetical protein